MGFKVTVKIGDADQIDGCSRSTTRRRPKAWARSWARSSQDETLKDLKGKGVSIDLEDIKNAADSNPVKKLINLVLLQAIKDKASATSTSSRSRTSSRCGTASTASSTR